MLRGTEGARLASYYLAGADPRIPYASPLYADPTGLPPTLIQVGSDEILLDDSVRRMDRGVAAEWGLKRDASSTEAVLRRNRLKP